MEKHLREYMRKYMSEETSFIYDLGVVGLGYVGLPLAVESANRNLSVLGFDIDESRINDINKGLSPIEDVSDSELADVLKNFTATSDSSKLCLLYTSPSPRDRG